jgi:glycosyltransferase involved in cell wall biosynthesis
MSARIVVAHPSRQHSHQLAAALHARGALHQYWTGLPIKDVAVDLPGERVRMLPIGSGAHFIERHLLFGANESVLGQMGDYATDNLFARWLRRTPGLTAVVGYENASFATFRTARELGVRTILDAAALHHATADRWREMPARSGWARDVRGHKDAEIELADHILVLSALARDSYVEAGVPAQRISIVPLGYDAAVFSATGEPQVGTVPRFVFVGNAGRPKGLDTLLDAASRLSREGARFELVVIGDVEGDAPGAAFRGKLSQPAIAAEFARADCLVLPSRCDAFGLVVAEAIGSGIPAIVSEHVGAKDLVAESGAGWIVPAADPAALAERMRACIRQPQEVLDAKRKARAAASAWTWERYRTRAADTVLGRLGKGGA